MATTASGQRLVVVTTVSVEWLAFVTDVCVATAVLAAADVDLRRRLETS